LAFAAETRQLNETIKSRRAPLEFKATRVAARRSITELSKPVEVEAMSQRLTPTDEQSGLLTRIATTTNGLSSGLMKN
jgi:hypothetical protein